MTTYTAHFTNGPVSGRTATIDGTPPNGAAPARLQLAVMAEEQDSVVRVPLFDRADLPYVLTGVSGTDAQYQHEA